MCLQPDAHFVVEQGLEPVAAVGRYLPCALTDTQILRRLRTVQRLIGIRRITVLITAAQTHTHIHPFVQTPAYLGRQTYRPAVLFPVRTRVLMIIDVEVVAVVQLLFPQRQYLRCSRAVGLRHGVLSGPGVINHTRHIALQIRLLGSTHTYARHEQQNNIQNIAPHKHVFNYQIRCLSSSIRNVSIY